MAGMSVAWSESEGESDDIVMGLPTSLMYAGNIVESRKVETDEISFFTTSDNFESDFNFETWIASPTKNDEPQKDFCKNGDIYNTTTGLRCSRYTGTSIITAEFSKSKKLYIVGGLLSAQVKFYEKTPFST